MREAMRKSTIMLVAFLFTTVGSPVFAKKRQKAELKKEKKELKIWKKRKASMQPLQLKDLVEENNKLKIQNQQLREEIKTAKNTQEKELIALSMQIKTQNEEQHRRSKELHEVMGLALDGLGDRDWAIGKDGQRYIKGIIFKVQIGAYKKRDLSNVVERKGSQHVFEQEQSKEVNIYTLGHFRDYYKANQFKKELRAMGLRDAWVVAYKDGKRVPLKEVLQEIVNKNK